MTYKEKYEESLKNHSKIESDYLDSLELEPGEGTHYINVRGFERGAFRSYEDAKNFADIIFREDDDLYRIYKR